jgi:hypothetical protein
MHRMHDTSYDTTIMASLRLVTMQSIILEYHAYDTSLRYYLYNA